MTSPGSDAASSAFHRAVAGRIWLLNVGASALLSALYLRHAPALRSFDVMATLALGLLANAALWTLVPGIFVQVVTRVVRSPGFFASITASVWTLAQTALFVDTVIYGIFRYHFNAMVWNVLTTSGAGDAVHIGAGQWGLVALGAAVYWLILHTLVRRLSSRAGRPALAGEPPSLPMRPGAVWGFVLAPAVVVAMGLYAHADFARNRYVMALSRLFPLYPQLTVKRLLRDEFGIEPAERVDVDLPAEGILLDYPKARPAIDPGGPRPDIVLIVVDSLRADMLEPEEMPHLTELPNARVFRNHLSGGNATRFGLFSLVYGLHGSYWNAVYAERRSPVLMDALIDLGYDTHVFSRVSMSYPEFRSTAWVRIEEQVEDQLISERPGGWDDGVVARFDEWLAGRPADAAPFFAFALIDAPHQDYHFPADEAVFTPYADEVDYLRLSQGASPEETRVLFNRYRNAVRYADESVGKMFASLAAHGLLDETIVVVTGDHGEEFFENGFHGHTSNFTAEQVRVPFVMSGPGIPPGQEGRPTSHIDLPATLLELLGADAADRGQWTLGGNLLTPEEERTRVVSGWDLLCLWNEQRAVVVPTATHRGGLEVYDDDWTIPDDDASVLRTMGPALGQLALDCRRFVR